MKKHLVTFRKSRAKALSKGKKLLKQKLTL